MGSVARHPDTPLGQRAQRLVEPIQRLAELTVDPTDLVDRLGTSLTHEFGVPQLAGVPLPLLDQLVDLLLQASTLGLEIEDAFERDREIAASDHRACGGSLAIETRHLLVALELRESREIG